jgi:hypothetical protein
MWWSSAVNRSFFLVLAASRTRSSAWLTPARCRARSVLCRLSIRFAAQPPRSPAFAPPAPPRVAPRCSPASSLPCRGLTSHLRASPATAPRLPGAGQGRCRLWPVMGSPGSRTRSVRTCQGPRPRRVGRCLR